MTSGVSGPVFIAVLVDPDNASWAVFSQKPEAIKSILFHFLLVFGKVFTIQGNLFVDASFQIFSSTCYTFSLPEDILNGELRPLNFNTNNELNP